MPNWFLHNTFADLPGPLFLTVYLSAIVATIVGAVWTLRRADPTSKFDLPEIPTHPDPYEIAYLRGGDNEVLRAALFGLIAKGNIEIVPDNSSIQKTKSLKIVRTALPPKETHTDPIACEVNEALPEEFAPARQSRRAIALWFRLGSRGQLRHLVFSLVPRIRAKP